MDGLWINGPNDDMRRLGVDYSGENASYKEYGRRLRGTVIGLFGLKSGKEKKLIESIIISV